MMAVSHTQRRREKRKTKKRRKMGTLHQALQAMMQFPVMGGGCGCRDTFIKKQSKINKINSLLNSP
jgi:hypothetical protein